MYRFLLTPRWLGFLALALVAATVMVLLGNWQHGRYELRKERQPPDRRWPAPPTPVPLDTVVRAGRQHRARRGRARSAPPSGPG